MSRDLNNSRSIASLPRLLRDARFLRQLTLAEASTQIGISASTLMRWEKGTHTTNPTLEQLEAAAKWLGLVIDLRPASAADMPSNRALADAVDELPLGAAIRLPGQIAADGAGNG